MFHCLPDVSRRLLPQHIFIAVGGALLFAGASIGAGSQTVAVTPVNSGLNMGSANVCPAGQTTPAPCSETATVTFKFTSGGSIGVPAVLTTGAPSLDFTDAGTGTCTTNGTSHVYNTNNNCTVNVKFAPMYPGQRKGAVVLKDSSGTALAAAFVYGTGIAPQVVFSPSTVSLLGGNDYHFASGIAVDGSGNVYVTEGSPGAVEEMPAGCASSDCVTILGGGFIAPVGLAVDGIGNVYVADEYAGTLSEMPAGCASSKCVTTLVGGFSFPDGVAVDGSGNIYVTEAGNGNVREMPAGCTSSGCLKTLDGGFSSPLGVAVDGSGNVYVGDEIDVMYGRGAVKEMPAGCTSSACVKTLGGVFYGPYGLAVDASGNVYVAHDGEVAEMPAGCASSACVTSLGLGEAEPQGVALDGSGNIYVVSMRGYYVREIYRATPPTLAFDTTLVGSQSAQTLTVANIGNADLTFPGPDTGINPTLISTGFTLDSATTCPQLTANSTPATLATGASCKYVVDFKPESAETYSGSLALTDDSLNAASPDFATQIISFGGIAFGPPSMTSPAPDSVLSSSSATFTWTANANLLQYRLTLGTTGAGSANVYNGVATASTSAAVSNIPTQGIWLYARLFYEAGKAWHHIDCIYTEAGTVTPPALTSPAPGSTLSGASATFNWTPGVGPVTYNLAIGDTGVGSDGVFYYPHSITRTSMPVLHIPIVGKTLYVRLSYEIDNAWKYVDYTLTEAMIAPPVLTSPAPGSTLSGTSATFTWNPGLGSDDFVIRVGTKQPGSYDVYNGTWTSGSSQPVSNIPTNGMPLYVRLIYHFGDTWDGLAYTWDHLDYTYTEAGIPTPPALSTPAPGSTLNSSSATFTWNPGAGPRGYMLRIGTQQPGSYDVYNGAWTTGSSQPVSNIPTNGMPLYVRLLYEIGNTWDHLDYTYTESGTPTPPALTTPAPGSTLSSSSATFTWSPGAGPRGYMLRLGTKQPGSYDVYNGAWTTGTSAAVSTIPTNSKPLYVQLRYEIGNTWNHIDYIYTEGGLPALITPKPGSTLTGSSVTFTWSPGADARGYMLRLGTTGPGSHDVYNGAWTTTTSAAVSGIPTSGKTLYVRLMYEIDSTWHSIDYTYTEK